MTASPHTLPWLAHPAAAGAALAGQRTDTGVVPALCVETAWPYRDGFVARLRGPDGSCWGVASLDPAGITGVLARAVAGNRVLGLPWEGSFLWRHADDPALALSPEPPPAGAGEPRWSESDLLGYKPLSRCVLRQTRAPGQRPMIAKFYARARDERTVRIHSGLALSVDCSHMSVPGPVEHLPRRRALVWPAEEGRALLEALQSDRKSGWPRRAAAVLAGLHRGRASWSNSHLPQDELDVLRRWTGLAARVRPQWACSLERRLDALANAAARLPRGPLVPSHRDFYDKQVLVGGARDFLLDLDTACLAEPELDAGNFVAHLELRELQGRLADPDGAAAEFLAHYAAAAGAPDPARLDFYRSCTRLRLACVYSVRPACAGVAASLVERYLN